MNRKAIIMYTVYMINRSYPMEYVKFGLVIVDQDKLHELGLQEPKMISEHSKGVLEVVSARSVYFGKGISSEGAQYFEMLKGWAKKLNSKFEYE